MSWLSAHAPINDAHSSYESISANKAQIASELGKSTKALFTMVSLKFWLIALVFGL